MIALGLGALLGSVPFALLIGLARGVDIRRIGSRNPGATNLGRALGLRYFFLAFVADAGKGLAPSLIWGLRSGLLAGDPLELDAAGSLAWLSVAAAPVLGHMFSPWVGFKGGKGVATGLGAMLGVWPWLGVPAIGAAAVFGVTLAVWRYVGLASSLAAASLPLWTWYFFAQLSFMMSERARTQLDRASEPELVGWPYVAVAFALAAAVIWKHRGNLGRIVRGSEPRIGRGRSVR
jgi:glycerol-3-phosphate acyltransferase PlsY